MKEIRLLDQKKDELDSVENREMMVGFTLSSDPDDVSFCPSGLVGDEGCDEEQVDQ